MNLYISATGGLLPDLFGIVELSWKISNLSLPFSSEFPPGDEMISKIQFDPSPFGYGMFFKIGLADF